MPSRSRQTVTFLAATIPHVESLTFVASAAVRRKLPFRASAHEEKKLFRSRPEHQRVIYSAGPNISLTFLGDLLHAGSGAARAHSSRDESNLSRATSENCTETDRTGSLLGMQSVAGITYNLFLFVTDRTCGLEW